MRRLFQYKIPFDGFLDHKVFSEIQGDALAGSVFYSDFIDLFPFFVVDRSVGRTDVFRSIYAEYRVKPFVAELGNIFCAVLGFFRFRAGQDLAVLLNGFFSFGNLICELYRDNAVDRLILRNRERQRRTVEQVGFCLLYTSRCV